VNNNFCKQRKILNSLDIFVGNIKYQKSQWVLWIKSDPAPPHSQNTCTNSQWWGGALFKYYSHHTMKTINMITMTQDLLYFNKICNDHFLQSSALHNTDHGFPQPYQTITLWFSTALWRQHIIVARHQPPQRVEKAPLHTDSNIGHLGAESLQQVMDQRASHSHIETHDLPPPCCYMGTGGVQGCP
jgi:hypothetical protein